MTSEILEGDVSQESNVAAEDTKVAEETKVEPATTEQPTEVETQEEPTIELDGEKVPLSQVKKWKEDYGNDSKWKDKNRRESEDLNQKRQRFAHLELIDSQLQQRPELLTQIFAPQAKRDFNAELQGLLARRPDQFGQPNEYVAWEIEKERMLLEHNAELVAEKTRNEQDRIEAFRHNNDVETGAREKYSGKTSPDEFQQMTHWIVENVNARNGRYPKNAYDLAYKALYEDRWVSEVRVEAAKKAVAPLTKTAKTSGVDTGLNKQTPQTSPEDEEDASFISALKERK